MSASDVEQAHPLFVHKMDGPPIDPREDFGRTMVLARDSERGKAILAGREARKSAQDHADDEMRAAWAAMLGRLG